MYYYCKANESFNFKSNKSAQSLKLYTLGFPQNLKAKIKIKLLKKQQQQNLSK